MVAFRKCFLCNEKKLGNNNLTLHGFPKNQQIQKIWKYVCGLRSEDIVSRIYVCSNHFKPEDYQCIRCTTCPKFLKNGAVPSVSVVNKFNYTNAEILSATACHQNDISLRIPPTANIFSQTSSRSNVNSIQTVPMTPNKIDVKNSLAVDYTSDENTEQQIPKKRQFHDPRHVSEIRTTDSEIPRRASQIIKFVKENNMPKSAKIKLLQKEKYNLIKKITRLKTMLVDLREEA